MGGIMTLTRDVAVILDGEQYEYMVLEMLRRQQAVQDASREGVELSLTVRRASKIARREDERYNQSKP